MRVNASQVVIFPSVRRALPSDAAALADLVNRAYAIEGFFVDVYHRPKGWSDVTLVARHEKMETLTSTTETTTLGTKLRGPWDTSVYFNYRFGPNMNTVAFGGPWSVGVFKTLRFKLHRIRREISERGRHLARIRNAL